MENDPYGRSTDKQEALSPQSPSAFPVTVYELRDFSPQANYTDRTTAACRRSLVPTFADRVSRGQRNESPRPLISVF
jgi:hypothetical protein